MQLSNICPPVITSVRVTDVGEVERPASWILHLHTSHSTCHEAAVLDVSPPIRLHRNTLHYRHTTLGSITPGWQKHLTETLQTESITAQLLATDIRQSHLVLRPDLMPHITATVSLYLLMTPRQSGASLTRMSQPTEICSEDNYPSPSKSTRQRRQFWTWEGSRHTFLSETTVNAVRHTGTLSPQLPGDWRDEDGDRYWPAVPDVTSWPAAYHAV